MRIAYSQNMTLIPLDFGTLKTSRIIQNHSIWITSLRSLQFYAILVCGHGDRGVGARFQTSRKIQIKRRTQLRGVFS